MEAETDAPVMTRKGSKIPDYTPNENSIDISNEQDGTLYKEITKEGEGELKPSRGATVFVTYIGRLADGTEFDRSVNTAKPFSFELGKKTVIKGWEFGVATMKKGEEATLIIHSTLGYDDKDTGRIPPNSTLFFDIVLLDWEDEDISPDKSRGITWRLIQEGPLHYLKPNEGATVEVELEGSYDGNVFDKRKVTFELGEGSESNLCKGLETAIRAMATSDIAIVTIKPEFAFGQTGNENFSIPPNATIQYKVYMLKFKKMKELWDLTGLEKVEECKKFKEKGTKYFKEEKYSLAVSQYKRMVDYLKAEALLKGEDEETRKSLLCASYLNQSICFLKLKEYVKARNCAESALELEPSNSKAHFRKGMAYYMTKDFEIAITDFENVLKLEPENKAAQQQLISARQKAKEEDEISKKLYSKMFKYNCKLVTKL